jgi:hypothetical protein
MKLEIISGQKGGVGKTLFAHARAAWLDKSGIAWAGADTDTANRFFNKLHPVKVAPIILYDRDGSLAKETALDLVDSIAAKMDAGDVDTYVIDMGAGQLDAFLSVFRKTGLFAEVGAALQLTVFYVITNDIQSVSTLSANMAEFDTVPGTQWIVVRNFIVGETKLYDESKNIRPAMLARNAKEVEMPNLFKEDESLLDGWKAAKVTIDAYAVKFASFSRRALLKGWLNGLYAQFDTIAADLHAKAAETLAKAS